MSEQSTLPTKCDICGNPIEYKERDDIDQFKNSSFDMSSIIEKFRFTPIGHEKCQEIREQREVEAEMNKKLETRRGEFFRSMKSASRALPLNWQNKTFDSYIVGPNVKEVDLLSAWNPTNKFGVFLIGPAGTGKTHLMTAVFNKIMAEADTVCRESNYHEDVALWANMTELVRQVRNEELGERDYTTLKRAQNVMFLFMDDIGTGNVSDYTRETLYLILEHRKNNGLPTFMTANLKADEMSTAFHERVSSRIKEGGDVLMIEGGDFRNNVMKSHRGVLEAQLNELRNERNEPEV